jgi:hypothetical protein
MSDRVNRQTRPISSIWDTRRSEHLAEITTVFKGFSCARSTKKARTGCLPFGLRVIRVSQTWYAQRFMTVRGLFRLLAGQPLDPRVGFPSKIMYTT